jgi:hypothetical protein
MEQENGSYRSQKIIRVIILLIISGGFFVTASLFNLYGQAGGFVKWNSPDETANYYFAKLYAQTGNLSSFEKFNRLVENIIAPRSIQSDNGYLKPVSFLGMTLIYGKLAGLTSIKLLPYFTPAFAALGLIFFYFFVKELFGPSTGLVSAALLALFPPYFYYASRSMFHNVLFVVLLIIGLYFATIMSKKDRIIAVYDDDDRELKKKARNARLKNMVPRLIYPAIAGLFVGAAVMTRTSELLWLAPVLFFGWLFNYKRIGLIRLVVFLLFLVVAATPVLYWNKQLYGGAFKSGYPQMNNSLVNLVTTSQGLVKSVIDADLLKQRQLWSFFKSTIFFFGFDSELSLRNFYNYVYMMFPWLFYGAGLGLVVFLLDMKRIRSRQMIFVFCWTLASVILVFYYGSWQFHDNPDPRVFTIGNSYTRYWLPIYLGAIPFAGLLIVKLTRLAKFRFAVGFARIYLVSVIGIFSVLFILFGSNEGLVPTYYVMRENKAQADKIFALTEPGAVIITRYHDKVLFPEREVIVGLFDDDRMNAEYGKLVRLTPVYYYNFSYKPADVEYLNRTKLSKSGVGIREVSAITKQFSLYKLYATSTPVLASQIKAK